MVCNRLQNKIFYLNLFCFIELIKDNSKIKALNPVVIKPCIYVPQ
jgi:hypothetical protein